MKKFIFFIIVVCGLFLMNGCVENSQKYKDLKASLDSIQAVSEMQNAEMENLFADINEISAGMQSIREAEHLIILESDEEMRGSKSRQQLVVLKKDIAALSDAIANYKAQIARLEGRNKRQSAELKKLIAGLNEELEQKSQQIAAISMQLADKDKQLAAKSQQIESLNKDMVGLNQQTAEQKEVITRQDLAIHEGNYLIGNRKELKSAHVISRQGIFCPPIVSSQVQQADFKTIDIRQTKEIPLQSKKAKVLSVHPSDSYTLETDENGMLILKIQDENAFWKQTKYLVIMIG